MIKKIFITLILISPLGFVQAITVNEIVDKASALWSKEKQIKKPDFSLIDIEGNTYTDESTDGKYLVALNELYPEIKLDNSFDIIGLIVQKNVKRKITHYNV